MRVLAISGSLRKDSTNTAALEALAGLAIGDMRVVIYRDLARLPPFNPDDDLEDEPKPETIEALRAMVAACDAIVIAAPEYAHGVPGAPKNALDWLVASETFAGKTVVLINASPRAYHAQASLREILSNGGALSRGRFRRSAADRQEGHGGRDRRRPCLRRTAAPRPRRAGVVSQGGLTRAPRLMSVRTGLSMGKAGRL